MDTDFIIDIFYHIFIIYKIVIVTICFFLIIRGSVDGKEIRFIQIRL